MKDNDLISSQVLTSKYTTTNLCFRDCSGWGATSFKILFVSSCLLFFRGLFVHGSGREELSVLGRVRYIDQQPSAQPELGDKHGKREKKSHVTVVSGPDNIQKRVEDKKRSGNGDGVSQPAGEDTPQDNGQTEEEEVDTRKD